MIGCKVRHVLVVAAVVIAAPIGALADDNLCSIPAESAENPDTMIVRWHGDGTLRVLPPVGGTLVEVTARATWGTREVLWRLTPGGSERGWAIVALAAPATADFGPDQADYPAPLLVKVTALLGDREEVIVSAPPAWLVWREGIAIVSTAPPPPPAATWPDDPDVVVTGAAAPSSPSDSEATSTETTP